MVGTTARMSFWTGEPTSAERLSILGNGRVGIGADDPQAKLDVNGLIQSSEGIKITGGTADDVGRGIYFSSAGLSAVSNSHGANVCGLSVAHVGNGSNSAIASSLRIVRGASNGSERPDYRGINIFDIKANTAGHTAYGIYSGLTTSSTANNYNFYATGTAPNYFKGTTYVASDSTSLPATDNSGGVGVGFTAGGYVVSQYNSSTEGSAAWNLNRTGSTTGKLVQFKYATAPGTVSQVAGYIALTSANTTSFTQTSDYRLKENIVDLPNATSRLQALKPYQYNFKNDPDVLHEGFVAHELQENTVLTVFGTKDATEAIGTLADYDGTVLQTEVPAPSAEELTYTEEVEVTPYVAPVKAVYSEPNELITPGVEGKAAVFDDEGNELEPAVEYQEPVYSEPVLITPAVEEVQAVYETVTRTRTWTPSGTRPVYQGVDQTKLIPLLTKALQEALERIEVLEGKLAAD